MRFGTALQLMYEYPKYTYTQSAAANNEWMAEKYTDMNAELKQRIKERRWEIVGGMWVEPDLNMPDGESLVRQLLVGKRWYKQAYGVNVHIGWDPDSFGYTWQLPQIYKAEDAKGLIFRVYEWAGKDARVEFHLPPGASSATVTNLQETPENTALTVSGDVVKAPIHPYEILTVRVDYPNGGPKD